MKSLVQSGKLDKLGITASLICAIHCAALPAIITTLPLLGLDFLANIWFEIGMLSLSLCVGIYTLVLSYSKHRKVLPVLILATGFVLIGTGHFIFDNFEFILIPAGGLLIATAHLVNWRHTKTCSH